MQIMLSELQQKHVWDGLLSAMIRSNYFADLCHRYQRAQRIITWATLVSSSGAALSLMYQLPATVQWLRPVLALATAGLTLWSLVANNNKSATDCSDLHFRWNTLANDYEALWTNMYAPDAQGTLNSLRHREAEIAKTSVSFPNKEDLMRKWTRHIVTTYAPATS